jgi:hypothetical protein
MLHNEVCLYTVVYSFRERDVTHSSWHYRQQHVNKNRGMVFSVQSMLMTVHATMEYATPSLSNNCTAKEEHFFLCRL